MTETTPAKTPVGWTQIPEGPHDIRLVVSDLDGTLLDENSQMPQEFWDLAETFAERGIVFVPSSGRQYARLKGEFERLGKGVSYIAENGNLVVHDDHPISVISVDDEAVQRIIARSREAAEVRNIGLVVCGVKSAYIERGDREFVKECDKYYADLTLVDDLAEVRDDVLKLAVYDFDDSEANYETQFKEAARGYQAVLSGKHWLDIMQVGVDKGQGVIRLQEELGVSPEQTAVFGDYLNDLEMLGAGHWSFAVENAHPQIREAANYLAPANSENGVVSVLRRLLGEESA